MSISFTKRPALALAATVALGSAVVVIPAAPSLAAPAAVSHATLARTAPVSTVKTQWAWANGSTLTAKNVAASALSASSYYLRVEHNQGTDVRLLGVLPNGNGIGLGPDNRVREYTKTGSKAFAKGGGPVLMTAAVVGSEVYGITWNNELLRFSGSAAKAVNLGKLSGSYGFQPVISGSRVYWTRTVAAGKGKERYEVVSRRLSGGAVKVEGRDARDPQATDYGILVVRTGGPFATEDYPAIQRTTGIGVLGTKGVRDFLNFKGKNLYSQIGDGPWSFTASGRTLTLPEAGTTGQVVINLKNHQAWRVAAPKGTVVGWAGVSGARATWDIRNVEGTVVRNSLYSFNVDSGRASVLSTKANGYSYPQLNGKAIGWTYNRAGGIVEYKSIVLK